MESKPSTSSLDDEISKVAHPIMVKWNIPKNDVLAGRNVESRRYSIPGCANGSLILRLKYETEGSGIQLDYDSEDFEESFDLDLYRMGYPHARHSLPYHRPVQRRERDPPILEVSCDGITANGYQFNYAYIINGVVHEFQRDEAKTKRIRGFHTHERLFLLGGIREFSFTAATMRTPNSVIWKHEIRDTYEGLMDDDNPTIVFYGSFQTGGTPSLPATIPTMHVEYRHAHLVPFYIHVDYHTIQINFYDFKRFSPVFNKIVEYKMAKNTKDIVHEIENFSFAVVKAAVEFCYGNIKSEVLAKHKIWLLIFADYYDIKSLMNYVELYLINEVKNVETAVLYLNVLTKYNACNLFNHCISFLMKHDFVNTYQLLNEDVKNRFEMVKMMNDT